ncbi:1032_t:CDS:1 [Paraglomus occultum]|uniref:1032_t:CDS:1 n=1 Tax=Paraglomus occultum TaxID=144539 RepID=A0A9N9CFC6_9GLOM|nr:1032_t:CDS:1 [Paraglomus occultum]
MNGTRVIESENGWKVIAKKLKRAKNEQIQNDKQKIDLVESNVEMEKLGKIESQSPIIIEKTLEHMAVMTQNMWLNGGRIYCQKKFGHPKYTRSFIVDKFYQ